MKKQVSKVEVLMIYFLVIFTLSAFSITLVDLGVKHCKLFLFLVGIVSFLLAFFVFLDYTRLIESSNELKREEVSVDESETRSD